MPQPFLSPDTRAFRLSPGTEVPGSSYESRVTPDFSPGDRVTMNRKTLLLKQANYTSGAFSGPSFTGPHHFFKRSATSGS